MVVGGVPVWWLYLYPPCTRGGGKAISDLSDEFYHLIAESEPSRRSSPQASRAVLGRGEPGEVRSPKTYRAADRATNFTTSSLGVDRGERSSAAGPDRGSRLHSRKPTLRTLDREIRSFRPWTAVRVSRRRSKLIADYPDIGVIRSKALLDDRQSPTVQRLRLGAPVGLTQQSGEVGEPYGDPGMIRPEALLGDRQRPADQRLRLGVPVGRCQQ